MGAWALVSIGLVYWAVLAADIVAMDYDSMNVSLSIAEKILEQLGRCVVIRFEEDIVRYSQSPGVYAYIENGKAIYIGATAKGLTRVFASQDAEGKSIIFVTCKDEREAFSVEYWLIMEFRPRDNKTWSKRDFCAPGADFKKRNRLPMLEQEEVCGLESFIKMKNAIERC